MNHPHTSAASLLSIDDALPQALRDLGVGPDTLSAQQRAALDRDGYLLLPRHMPDERLEGLRRDYDRLMRDKYADYGRPNPEQHSDGWNHEAGTRRLSDLASEGSSFDGTYTDPVLLAATWHLMRRPFKLDSINAREALPGQGHQAMHRDRSGSSVEGSIAVNSAWLLDPFTTDNGPTRVVAGSQSWPDDPHQTMSDPSSPHPSETLVLAPAGSVFVFGCHVWHGGTLNRTSAGRRVVHVSFCRRDVDLGARDQRQRIRKAVYERISPAARWLLDV